MPSRRTRRATLFHLSRPPPKKIWANARDVPIWFAISASILVIWLGFIVWAQAQFGSYRYALRYLSGSRLQAIPEDKFVGSHGPGETLETTVTIRNFGTLNAAIVGALADCSCIGHAGLPRSIEPGGAVVLPIHVRFGTDAGDWQQSITFMTNDARQPTLSVRLRGVVVATPVAGLTRVR